MKQWLSSQTLLLLLVLPYATTASPPKISQQNATIEALIYGASLELFTTLAFADNSQLLNNTNHLFPVRELATPSSGGRFPNDDTLYSTGLTDLSKNDLEVCVPAVDNPRRFLGVAFYDIYGNNFANLGTALNSTPGTYLLRGPGSSPANINPKSNHSDYKGIIKSPTTYGSVLARILLLNDSDAELSTVHNLQDEMVLGFHAAKTRQARKTAPALTAQLLNNQTLTTPSEILSLLAKLAKTNPPEVPSDAAKVTATLEAAGINITQGTYTTPPTVNLTLAFQDATAIIKNYPTTTTTNAFLPASPQWLLPNPSTIGNFLTNYAGRAYWDQTGPLAQTSNITLYPGLKLNQTLQLGGNQALMVTFSGKPVFAGLDGFWSLTMYNATRSFVANALERYELGDRSGIAYADGERVYGSSSSSGGEGGDGVFELLLQGSDPGGNWTSNWLPTPADGSVFNTNLRFYHPSKELLPNGGYVYPEVMFVDAIKA